MGDRFSVVQGRRLVRVVAAAIVAAVSLPSAAQAHAFLVGSNPPAGARLGSAPAEIVLRFSEPYVRGSEHVAIRRADGAELALAAAPSGSGTVVHQALPPHLHGIFVVSWRVVSVDGHLSAGELAFSVGTGGALPAVQASAESTPWSQVVASWLFFLGLAVALGGLLSERLVWGGRGLRAPLATGVAISTVSSLALLVLMAGARTNGGFRAGLHGTALRQAIETRAGALTLAVVGSLAIAAALVRVGRTRVAAVVPLTAAAILTSARGHAASGGHWWAPVVDSIHLLAVAAWVGALVHLALVLVRSPDRGSAGAAAIRRYSRLALPTVLVVLASGVLSAFAEFRSVHSVFHSSYGHTLVVKSAIVLAVLAVAATSRLLALRRLQLLRRLTLTESALLVTVLAAAGLLTNLAPPRTSAVRAIASTTRAPLNTRALRLAAFAGRTAVGLAASNRELQFTLVPPPGHSANDYRLTADARRPDGRSIRLYPRPCGPGCFSIRYAVPAGTTHVTATVASASSRTSFARFDVPGPISAPRPGLLRRVSKAMGAAPSVDVTEQLANGSRALGGPTTYRLTGGEFLSGETFHDGAIDVHVLGHSQGLTELALAARNSSTWYRLWIDGAARLRREEIVSSGLLARRTIGYPRAHALAAARIAPQDVPTGPFTAAREDGDLAVGFAAQPAAGMLTLTTTVIGPDGLGATAVRVAVALTSKAETRGPADVCAPGCYRVALPFTGQPRVAVVAISRLGHAPTAVRFDFPSIWTPPSGTQIVSAATRVFDRLRSVTIDEYLRSNPSYTGHTHWRLEAPNRLAYTAVGGNGAEGVVIGKRRWDRDSGSPWKESPQFPVHQVIATWGAAPREAALLGSGRLDGREVWRVSFSDPAVPAWYTAEIDKTTLRTLAVQMVAPAHFMRHTYGDFNTPSTIRPPK